MRPTLFILALSASATIRALAVQTSTDPAQVEFFERRSAPLLTSHCYNCHSADTKPDGELRVDDLNGLLSGGKNGPAVVPGHPEKASCSSASPPATSRCRKRAIC